VDKATQPYRVRVEFPESLAISDEELALIETYLGPVIAGMVECELPACELPRQALRATTRS
jgi:hypothetical protein